MLFVDLDGTLLDQKVNGQWKISQINKKAITQCRKNGIEVVVSTGRIGWTVGNVLQEVSGNYFILGNGALIVDKTKQVIFEKRISKITFIRLINFANKHKLIMRVSFDHKLYGVSSLFKKLISKNFGAEFTSGYSCNMSDGCHKILFFGLVFKSKMRKIKAKLESEFPKLEIVNASRGYAVEITAKDVSKGHGANFFIKKFKIKKEQTAHIGDEMNDAKAKNFVGSLVAMKNANPQLKKIADYIAPNHKQGGVAKFIVANEYFN